MIVQYFIQGDNNKDLYAFSVTPSSQELTVADIKNNFPLIGNYYLRFKTILQDEVPAIAVWLDGLDDYAPVPTFKEQIIVKVLQIPPFDSNNILKPPRKVYKEYKQSAKNSTNRKASDLLVIDDFAHFKHQERSHSAIPNVHNNQKIVTSPDTKRIIDPTDGLSTEQLKKRAEDRIKVQVAQKTEDVKKIWQDEANLRQEKLSADKEYSEKLNNWEARNHQKNNIRTLLATMHNVL